MFPADRTLVCAQQPTLSAETPPCEPVASTPKPIPSVPSGRRRGDGEPLPFKGRYPIQTMLPGSIASSTNGIRLSADASAMWRIRIRPIPGHFPLRYAGDPGADRDCGLKVRLVHFHAAEQAIPAGSHHGPPQQYQYTLGENSTAQPLYITVTSTSSVVRAAVYKLSGATTYYWKCRGSQRE